MGENVGAALERAARLYPDAEAVVDGDVRIDYRELQRRVAGFDGALDRLGLESGDVVGVLALNSLAHLIAWLGVPRSGRVMNDLNTRLALSELEFILKDSGAKALIVDDQFAEYGVQLLERVDSITTLIHDGSKTVDGALKFDELTQGEPRPMGNVERGATAGIFYTGGTTGLPKGVMLTHENLIANAKHALILVHYDETDSYIHITPMFHLADGLSTFAITWVGGKHVIVPSFTAKGWLETVARERITRTLLVPTMIQLLLNEPGLKTTDISSLHSVLYGASPCPVAVLQKAMQEFGCDFGQLYGMTEGAPICTFLTFEEHRRGAAGEPAWVTRLASAGRAVVGVEVEIRRADGSPADIDEPGEIWVRGPNIMSGYWNRPEETEAALDADGWYHSGDAAFIDTDGYVFVVDRVKDMIISGGENIYCTEVENALYQHPAIAECAVFGVPDDDWGERVYAAVVLRDGQEVSEQAIQEHCRTLIAGYKVPRGIDFHAEPLPKSGAGKLLKRELRRPYWEGRDRQVS